MTFITAAVWDYTWSESFQHQLLTVHISFFFSTDYITWVHHSFFDVSSIAYKQSCKTKHAKRHSIIRVTYITLILLFHANIYAALAQSLHRLYLTLVTASALPSLGESLATFCSHSGMDGAKQPTFLCTSVAKGKKTGCAGWWGLGTCSADPQPRCLVRTVAVGHALGHTCKSV